jgi:hypothetical protein
LLTVARAAPPPTGDFVEIDFADEEDDEFPLFDDPADAVAPVKPAAAAAAAVDVPPPVVGDELFEDEFGDASPPPQLGAAASSAKGARAQRINSASKPRGPPPPPKTFKMEGAFLVLLVVYLFAYLRGSGVNAEIAQKWLDRFVGEPSSAEFKSRARVLRREFEIVGAVGTIATDDVIGMSFANFQSSYSDYALWATGRRNCRGMLAHLNLRRRQDLLSTIVLETLGMSATRDVLTLDFILNDGEAEPFVFALLRSANKDGFLAKTRGSDVKELCGSSKHYAKKKLVALYASSEVERHVMMPAVVKTVTENAECVAAVLRSCAVAQRSCACRAGDGARLTDPSLSLSLSLSLSRCTSSSSSPLVLLSLPFRLAASSAPWSSATAEWTRPQSLSSRCSWRRRRTWSSNLRCPAIPSTRMRTTSWRSSLRWRVGSWTT